MFHARLVHRLQCVRQSTQANASRISVQPAIKRSPTDLLSALASTVGTDSTAPHYQFLDDPTTIPTTLANKRNYFMAKELGKRAARQLAEEWPTLFAFDRDQPQLDVFRPQKPDDPMTVELNEENLRKMLKRRAVKDACMFYERMRSSDLDVSEAAKDELFRMSAYYNCSDPPYAENEEWHGLRNLVIQEESKWMTAGVADLLFESLPRTPERIGVMICALCKHSSPESLTRARSLYQELLSSGALPSASVVSSLVRHSDWKGACEMTKVMAGKGVRPTGELFHSLLLVARNIPNASERVSAVVSTLGEMSAMGVRPGLAAYNVILGALLPVENEGVQKKDDEKMLVLSLSALDQFLGDLEKREALEAETASDGSFFVTAMTVCSRTNNVEMAKRLVALVESPSNHIQLGALTSEGEFYQKYLHMLIRSLDSAALFEEYKRHVPRLVGLTRYLVGLVAEKLKSQPDFGFLRRLCLDAMASRLLPDSRVSQSLRDLLIAVDLVSLSPRERDEFTELVRKMIDAWIEFSRFTDPRLQRLQRKMAPVAVSECALLLSRIGDTQRAFELLELLLDPAASSGETATILPAGHARLSAITELLDVALRAGDGLAAASCLEILSTQLPRPRLEQLAQRIVDRCQLTANQQRILMGFVRLKPQ